MIPDTQLTRQLQAMLLTLETLLSPQRSEKMLVANLLLQSERSEKLVALKTLETVLSKPQRSERETLMAMHLTHRLMRRYVLDLAEHWTYSEADADADAINVAAEFWDIFWDHQRINEYTFRNGVPFAMSFGQWFKSVVTDWLVAEASV